DDHRPHVHEGAEQQEDQVEQQQDDDRILGHRLQPVHQLGGNAQIGHEPGEAGGGADDQQHHGGGADGTERGVDELAPAHAAVDGDGDDDGIDDGDAGALGGGEHTRAHAAEDDGDEQQPGDGDGAEMQDPLKAGEGIHRIAPMAGDEIGGEHQRRGEHQPGNDAGGEQVGDGDAAAA